MPTQHEILASIHAELAELRQIASADLPAPRRVRVKDVNGREQVISPLMVFHLAEDRMPARTPGYELPVTVLLYAASSGGNLVRVVLPGLPGAVATQLDIPFEQVELVPPAMMAKVGSVADANAAIAAISAKGSSVTDGNGNRWTIGPDGGTLKNGADFAQGFGSEYAIVRGVVHVLGTDNRWYAVDGEGWALIGADLPTGG